MQSDDNLDRPLPRGDGGAKKVQYAPPGKDILIEQANLKTDQANARTAGTNIRTRQADWRTEKAIEGILTSELNYRRLFEAARDGILILTRLPDASPPEIVARNGCLVTARPRRWRRTLSASRSPTLAERKFMQPFIFPGNHQDTHQKCVQAHRRTRQQEIP